MIRYYNGFSLSDFLRMIIFRINPKINKELCILNQNTFTPIPISNKHNSPQNREVMNFRYKLVV